MSLWIIIRIIGLSAGAVIAVIAWRMNFKEKDTLKKSMKWIGGLLIVMGIILPELPNIFNDSNPQDRELIQLKNEFLAFADSALMILKSYEIESEELSNDLTGINLELGRLAYERESVYNKIFEMSERFSKQSHINPITAGEAGKEIEKAFLSIYWQMLAMNERDFALRLKYLTESIRILPSNSNAYYNRGVINTKSNYFDDAIADFSTAISLNPYDAKAYNNRGWINFKKKEYVKSIQDFNIAIELDSVYALAYNNRGESYRYQNNFEIALKDYFKAITIDSSFTWPYNNIGMLFRNIKQYSISTVFFNKAIEIDSTFSKPYNNLALNYIDKNEYDKAIIFVKFAIRFEPTYSNAYNTLSLAFIMKREFEYALESLSKAIELEPDNYMYYDNRYKISLYLKKYDSTKQDLQKLIDLGHTQYICILDSLEKVYDILLTNND